MPSLPIPTDDFVTRVFIKSSSLEQVSPSILTFKQSGQASSAFKPSQWRYFQKVMFGGHAKAGYGFSSLLVSGDRTYSIQSSIWLSKAFCFLGHGSRCANV
ncbi:hypothetical protein TNCV_4903901 [Trichonephila clavipes]|nr:hypothetical protein TNCV_4903901 [Trichonephila clavipes]